MHKLAIATVFKNLNHYQAQYLDILENSALYFSPVEDAYIHIWPFRAHLLYLGDLLQLWLSGKWIEHMGYQPFINTVLRSRSQINSIQDHYVYAIKANLFTGQNLTKSWSYQVGQNQQLNLTHLLQYYCVFKSLKRPKIITAPY